MSQSQISSPARPRRASHVLIAYLGGFLPIIACYFLWFWSETDLSMGLLIRVLQLTLCSASGPLYMLVAYCTKMDETRYYVVGPAVGGVVAIAVLLLFLLTSLRRVSPLWHFSLWSTWLAVGAMLLILFGTK